MIITCRKDDDSTLAKLTSNKWLMGGLCGLLLLLVVALLLLFNITQNIYNQSGKKFTEEFLKFENTCHAGDRKVLYLDLCEADTILLISKSNINSNNLIYLDKNCTAEVRDYVKDSDCELNIFWIKGNYEVLYSYKCRGISSATIIEFSKRYFTGTGNTQITLAKYEKLVDRVKHEIITIN